MIRIGITGGIGSGKSVVSSLLAVYDIPVYLADIEGKRLSDESPVIRKKMIDLFGREIYVDDRLDRPKLATFVFGNEKLMEKVNKIIHPVVNKDFKNWVKHQETKFCALESAILFESGFEREVNVVLMVYASVELRLTRVMQRDNFSEAEVMKRMNRQLSDVLKREKSDYVIINDDKHPLIPQLEAFIKIITKNNIPQ
ncbi:MAG: dephospho-CoA kinase [Tannerella sp.]|jgi:dephospho-CoA kinase|nr:dephospho-CoA kinase [Tannerella sp.]